ncbi:hypothetical protein BaRGS_00023451 [Batillaria attramentaria]|uniref:Kinase n=1 Tax=Batillaria attramentaria TaxID=370345 RepID=A0ABD0KE85_9CAEN
METVQKADSGHLQPFHHQVAGQSLVFRYDATTISKSLIPREHDIYRTLPSILKPFVPDYRGVVDIPLKDSVASEHHHHPEDDHENHVTPHPRATERLLAKVSKSQDEEHVYRILRTNIVAGYRHPCVLDLKMGTRQHGDDAPKDKVTYQVSKCRNTTSAELGVRLCGMKVYQSTTGEYLLTDKAQGRRMRKHDFHQAVRQFLHNGRRIRTDIIPSILERLRRLKAVVSELPTFRFYSSSLLIVYDGSELACNTQMNTVPSERTSVNGNHQSQTNGRPQVQSTLAACNPGSRASVPGSNTTTVSASGNVDNSLQSVNDLSSDGKLGLPANTERLPDSISEDGENPQLNGQDRKLGEFDRQASGDGDCDGKVSSGGELNGGAEINSECNGDSMETDDTECDSTNRGETEGALSGMQTSSLSRDLVDVRLVDFAHTTFAGFGHDTVVHEGVDHGCLLGLQTLIDIFTQILQCQT